MSLSAPFIPVTFKDALDQTEPYWDYIVGNESEARAWAQSHGLKVCYIHVMIVGKILTWQIDDIPTIAQHMASLPKANNQRQRVAIITQGASSTVFAVSGVDGCKIIPVRKISAAEIVDTTGAGWADLDVGSGSIGLTDWNRDAFAGGLLAGIVQGESLETCIDMGHWLAHLGIQEMGPK